MSSINVTLTNYELFPLGIGYSFSEDDYVTGKICRICGYIPGLSLAAGLSILFMALKISSIMFLDRVRHYD